MWTMTVVRAGLAPKFYFGRLDHAKAAEITELLTDMRQQPGAGHYYVDISAPAETLVISLDEYV